MFYFQWTDFDYSWYLTSQKGQLHSGLYWPTITLIEIKHNSMKFVENGASLKHVYKL